MPCDDHTSAAGSRPRINTAKLGLTVASSMLGLGALAPAAHAITYHSYFAFNGGYGAACCGHRNYWTTAAHNAGNPVVARGKQHLMVRDRDRTKNGWVGCLQEFVSLSFYDGPQCAAWPNNPGHSLNGTHYDQPLCWENGSTTSIGCTFGYSGTPH
jgi:hypothetical protein